MKVYAVILLQILNLMQFQPGIAFEWSSFETRFARLSREATEKGSYSISNIEELKQDMLKACKNGDLKEFPGFQRFSDQFSLSTQFYYLPHDPDKSKTYFLLPQIVCVEGGDGINKGRNKPEVTIPGQGLPPFNPQTQIQPLAMPAHIPGWQGFKSRFAVIFQNAKENHGYSTLSGKLSIEELKAEMIKACENGELVEVGSSSGFVGDVLIATKEYIMPVSFDSQKIDLPAVDCRGSFNRRQLERKDEKERENANKKVEEAMIRAKNMEVLLQRKEDVKKRYPAGWRGFKSRYGVISEKAYNNYGYLSAEDLKDLQLLQLELTEACRAGVVVEFGPGDGIKDALERVVIPTKEYVLFLTEDKEKVILPAVDCPGRFLEDQLKKEAEKRLDIILRELMRDGLLIQQ